jgi:hypothetical protein
MIDPDLIDAAKRDMDRMKMKSILAQLKPEDQELLKKYPKHTLAAARLIDSTPTPRTLTGYQSAFDLIQLQERSNLHLSGDHT